VSLSGGARCPGFATLHPGYGLRYSFNMAKEADLIDAAIAAALAKGLRTADVKSEGCKVVSTREMGEAILGEMEKLAVAQSRYCAGVFPGLPFSRTRVATSLTGALLVLMP
jgi:hypothetical protein